MAVEWFPNDWYTQEATSIVFFVSLLVNPHRLPIWTVNSSTISIPTPFSPSPRRASNSPYSLSFPLDSSFRTRAESASSLTKCLMIITRSQVGLEHTFDSSGVLLRLLLEPQGALHRVGLLQRPASQGHHVGDVQLFAVSLLPSRMNRLLDSMNHRESMRTSIWRPCGTASR